MSVVIFIFCLIVPFYLASWLLFTSKKENTTLSEASTGISMIIPFRNENKNLPILLKCLSNLKLESNDEVLLVNDQSDDLDLHLFCDLPCGIRLINIDKDVLSSKKKALTKGISQSKNDWILTVDADCKFDDSYLLNKKKFANHKVDMVVAPVDGHFNNKSFWKLIAYIELIVLQTITKAGINSNILVLANGANLMFKKSSWMKVGGYRTHMNISSGDDVLLLQAFKEQKMNITYQHSLNAGFSTLLEDSCSGWINQRIRWASKSSHVAGLKEGFITLSLLIWMFNFIPGVLWFSPFYLLVLIVEFLLLKLTCPLPIKLNTIFTWPIFRVIYPFLVVLVFFASVVVKNPKWKGRPVLKQT